MDDLDVLTEFRLRKFGKRYNSVNTLLSSDKKKITAPICIGVKTRNFEDMHRISPSITPYEKKIYQ